MICLYREILSIVHQCTFYQLQIYGCFWIIIESDYHLYHSYIHVTL